MRIVRQRVAGTHSKPRGKWPKLVRRSLTVTGGLLLAFATQGTAHATSYTYTLYHNIRYYGGGWQGWQPPAQPPDTGNDIGVSNAGLSNGDLHVDALTASGLWDNIRHANGSWQGWAKPAQPPGSISIFADAALPGSRMAIVAATTSGLYYIIRYSDGSWSNWLSIAMPTGSINDIDSGDLAVTGTPSGNLQLIVAVPSGHVYHNIRSGLYGNWQGWASPAQPPGGALFVAAAGRIDSGADDEVQFAVVSPNGTLYHNIRYANGSWQGWAAPKQPPWETINGTRFPGTVSAAETPYGDTHFVVVVEGHGGSNTIYHAIRYADGSWSGWGAPTQVLDWRGFRQTVAKVAIAVPEYLDNGTGFDLQLNVTGETVN
jgi:hypothetical protein